VMENGHELFLARQYWHAFARYTKGTAVAGVRMSCYLNCRCVSSLEFIRRGGRFHDARKDPLTWRSRDDDCKWPKDFKANWHDDAV